MASPGPGYNPEVSLLQGGTAPILPVQGGGSMEAGAVPVGYRPDVSLLTPHVDATIQAVKGGGSQKGGEESIKAYQDYVVESYTPPLEMVAIPDLPSSSDRRALVNQYTELMKPSLLEVKSLEKGPEPFLLSDAVAPTYQRCATETGRPRVGPQFLETVRKRIVLIDTPDPHIWIVPQIEGRVSRFLQYMKLIPRTAEGKIQSNHVVVFTGSFFSTTTMNDNFNLYHQFLLEKVKNPKNLYVLNHLTSDFITISCNILRSMYSAETLRAPESQQKPLSTFFEPDVIVFTKPKILLRNSELPVQREDSSVKLSKILSLPKFPVTSFLIVPSKDVYDRIPSDDDTDIPAEKRFFFLSFQRTAKEIKTTLKAEIKCPEESGCQGFTVAYKLVEIGDDRRIDAPGLFLLYKSTEPTPFFKEKGAVPPVPPGPERPEIPSEEPPSEAPPSPPKPLPAFEAETPAKPLEEPFVSDPTATESKSTLTMDLNGLEHTVRIPYDPKVKEDWKAAKFTEGEAGFLNAMQLTSALLSETFGSKGWKPKLAEFLLSLTRSNCFKDPTLLTTRECSTSQEFVKRVYLVQYNRSLKAMYEKLGMPTPDTLEDILAALKRLGRVGPTKGEEGLTKYQFTGDVLNRYATIQFDPKTNEYFVDLVQMTDDVYTLLNKLKFFRAESKSYADIVRVILEQKGIPVPEAPTPPEAPKPPETETLYTIEDIQDISKLSQDAFDSIYTAGDGLCFYRAVLKGLLENPPEDKDSLYVPTETESLTFVKELKTELSKQKQSLLIKETASSSQPVETFFNTQFAPKAGEPEEIPLDGATQQDRDSRIRVGDRLKKMTFADYLKAMDDPDGEKRPYAEVHSAGIGTLAAKLTRTVIVIYVKLGKLFNLVAYYNEEEAAKGLPINRFIFLDHVGGNHYDLLKLKDGVEFPKKEGGGEELIEIGTVKVKTQTRKTRNHLGGLTRRHARHDH